MTRIILIGYMGAGKTTVGRELAKELGLFFYDLDWYIETRRRMTVKQIFDERGEEGFRQIEYNMLHEVAEFENVIISCGGGTPCFFDNMDYMNQQAETLYLKATPEVLYEPPEHGQRRQTAPAQQDPRGGAGLSSREQLKQREPFYEKARHIIDVNLMDNFEKISITVDEILKALNIKKNG